jgi:hypothetical protein
MGKKLMGLMPCFMGYHDYIFTIAYPLSSIFGIAMDGK